MSIIEPSAMKESMLTAVMLLLAVAGSASAIGWLFGGKEREHAGGLNSYDFSARTHQ